MYLIGAAAFAVAVAVPVWLPTLAGATTAAGTDHTTTADHTHNHATGDHSDTHQSAAPHAMAGADWEAMDQMMAERAEAFPAETSGVGGQVLDPEVLDDGTKQFTLTAGLVDWEIEPGKVVEAMAYNGIVPGPTIRVEVGDKVRVVLRNELPESTVIHWHGIPIINEMDGVADITQPPVTPGESFVYEISADRQSVGWYHSHHNGAHQVASGLWGAFLIGDLPLPGDLRPDQEVLIQLQDSNPIGLTFNGKSYPATEPFTMNLGESMLIHYFNAGGQVHPMHLHGLDQLVVGKDGFPLEHPYKADTVLVAPGERYSVLVEATAPGRWAFHCHIFTHSESSEGMFGMFTELIVR